MIYNKQGVEQARGLILMSYVTGERLARLDQRDLALGVHWARDRLRAAAVGSLLAGGALELLQLVGELRDTFVLYNPKQSLRKRSINHKQR